MLPTMNATGVILNNLHMTFSWIDYGLFLAMLLLSILIGLYFGCCGHQDTANEYLLGGKEMTVIPIAISLVASNISGLTLLGVPTEVFRFGSTYYLYVCMIFPVCLITYYVYLPVFYKLQLISTYEYLHLRFDRKIRLLSSGLFTIATLLYLPIVVYIPALALAQATQVNLHLIAPMLCSVCIFYTTIGGLKAVVWTDTLQFLVMMGSIIGVFYRGLDSVGGFDIMWKRAQNGRRLYFDFDLDPTKRDTVVATLVGTFFMCLTYMSVSQSFVQKYLSLPKRRNVKEALILFMFGMFGILTFVVLTGLIMYAKYYDCDPFTAGRIAKHDQVLPFYVMDVASTMSGLPGLFLSGLFSAALSTLSACMNCLAGSVYEDFISPFMPKDISQKRVSNILKILVMIIGIISTALVFAIEHVSSIHQINFSLSGITCGPLLGLFTLGILFPIANTKGALFGSLGSMAIMTFIIAGSQIQQFKNVIQNVPKPVSIAGCDNSSRIQQNIQIYSGQEDEVFILFKITYYYYNCLGTLLTLGLGVLISYFTRKESDPKVDPDLISPVAYWVINRFSKKTEDKGNYHEVNNTSNVVT